MHLSFGKLEFEVLCPVSEKNHRARVVIVFDVDAVKSHDLILWTLVKLKIVFVELIRVNNIIKSIVFSKDESGFD